MAIKLKKDQHRGIEIDLTGPEGNVFYLMGTAKSYAKQCGFDGDKIIEEMKASDYENAINVFDSYFGSIVTLLR